MSEVVLSIDNLEVTAKKGMTILKAADSVGIKIPTLCNNEELAPYGACRLCTVEIIKDGQVRYVASCVYPVEEGLIVSTASPEVVNIRKTILELMWSRAPGVQAIRDYGIEYGIDRTRFDIEPNLCILCGLCVRYCAEVKKKHAIGFIGRGIEKRVMFYPEIAAAECPSCGECFKICPTGVLPSNYALARVPNMSWEPNPFLK